MKNPSVITSRDAEGNLYPGNCGYSPTIACRHTDRDACPTECPYYWYSQNTRLYRGDRVAQATLLEYV